MHLLVKEDCRSPTGSNLRHLMKLARKARVDNVEQRDFDDLVYKEIPEEDVWRISCAASIIQVKNGVLNVDILTKEEIDQILEEVVAQDPERLE